MSSPCRCGAHDAERWPVLHHMPCAYVGPAYDFKSSPQGSVCPKCDIVFTASDRDNEILGYAWRCPSCGAEWLEETLS
ncbi:hypothetical protein [Aestuariivirga litoralis]|uniref:TackOD1 domain-containing metal-binding protein n=1 Tax=Aestuariivirga litoralis TaxID=2650924 RepID=UPI003CCAE644